MASRDDKFDKSERVDLSEELVEEEKEVVKSQQSETVAIVSMRNMKINYTGPVTKKLYVFDGAGAVVNVDVKDAEIMLAKRGGKCCPGGSGPAPYFSTV